MANQDPLDWSVLTTQSLIQRYVMVLLYFATEGDLWYTNLEWLSDLSVCDWFGVACSLGGFVSDLVLDNNGLFGALPTEFFQLTDLVTISLSTLF
jgi:hypothetical protein